MSARDCLLCRGADADEQLNRAVVWEDDLWRLSMSRRGYTTGFAYLEPKRHVPHVTDLDGEEAATFGPVLARATSALRRPPGPSSCTSTCSAAASRTSTSRSLRTARVTR